jgi:hypothetical protein
MARPLVGKRSCLRPEDLSLLHYPTANPHKRKRENGADPRVDYWRQVEDLVSSFSVYDAHGRILPVTDLLDQVVCEVGWQPVAAHEEEKRLGPSQLIVLVLSGSRPPGDKWKRADHDQFRLVSGDPAGHQLGERSFWQVPELSISTACLHSGSLQGFQR